MSDKAFFAMVFVGAFLLWRFLGHKALMTLNQDDVAFQKKVDDKTKEIEDAQKAYDDASKPYRDPKPPGAS